MIQNILVLKFLMVYLTAGELAEWIVEGFLISVVVFSQGG